ncbi:MAG: beta-propeller domain-containing protein [Gammaproteobacteria bacterium]|nr:beta-propeller domain-containing protein [Gammaproteobacteria bacterium]MDH4256533.1 beta-propeller domain-containing protein [Gammaproteobacteria bacterium]MDH5309872.1 beta-propeller domain-containing protein [Gammaproteobacteria bacterium]
MMPVSRTFPLALLAVLLALAGCGGSSSGSPDPGPGPAPTGLLRLVSEPAELEAAIKDGLTTLRPALFAEGMPAPATAPAADGNFTGTYTQEKNVDEFDVVRYDGEHLYIAPRRFMACCFMLAAADGTTVAGAAAGDSIRILATDPASASASVVSTIPLEQNLSVQGLYVSDDRLFALIAEAYYGSYGDRWASIAIWAPEKFGFRLYDVADKSAPVLETDVTMDGVFVESRRIGNVVYIVSRYAPELIGLIYAPQSEQERAHNEALLADVSLDDLLPTITINGVTQPLVDPANCYVPNDDRVFPYPVITSVTAVPIGNPGAFVNTCYNDETYGVYVSENALYFPQILSHLLPDDTRTRIHKFALSGTSMTYRGSADVQGQVWRGGQADFRMSETGGDLRVLTSDYTASNTDFVDHLLYILRESPTDPVLDIVSSLPNAARPEPIGKPNEQLYGVRFLGDRAYAVTFQQVDPLYVLDLSNAADPRIAGELEVTGFSDFLHPVGDGLLLGLGSGAGGGVKLELFDVSDIAAPLSRGSATIGGQGAWSEARYDRHAFTYQADINGVDRFTIPVSQYFDDSGTWRYELGLHLFEIRDKATPALASLVEAGRLLPPASTDFPYADRSRAFLHDDTVYFVQDETVWAAFWSSPTLVNGPY